MIFIADSLTDSALRWWSAGRVSPASTPMTEMAAVASCSIQFKKFVRATEDNLVIQPVKTSTRNPSLDGDEIQNFYDETVTSEEFSKKRNDSDGEIIESIDLLSSEDEHDSDVEVVDEVNEAANSELLKAIQNADLARLETLTGCDFNCVDEHGWTPLEIALVLGEARVVRLLLGRGAGLGSRPEVRDILARHGTGNMLRLLQDQPGDDDDVVECEQELVECGECGLEYRAGRQAAHKAGLLHQIAVTGRPASQPGFLLGPANRGYQLLARAGWDGRSGLGGHSHGRLHPVKTVLKRDRAGLKEGVARTARVTHFRPRDTASVTGPPRRGGVRPGRGGRAPPRPEVEQRLREDLYGL